MSKEKNSRKMIQNKRKVNMRSLDHVKLWRIVQFKDLGAFFFLPGRNEDVCGLSYKSLNYLRMYINFSVYLKK